MVTLPDLRIGPRHLSGDASAATSATGSIPKRSSRSRSAPSSRTPPIGLEKWLPALWLLTNCKNGISSYELARALGVTQKTAWFMLSRLRLALQAEHGGKMSGHVEADETFIGGKARNMHAAKRKRLGISQGRSMVGKVAVMGLLERHGKTTAARRSGSRVIANRKKHHLEPHIGEHVETGATVYTDALPSYDRMGERGYIHNVIDHAEAYVDGAGPHQRPGELLVAPEARHQGHLRVASNRFICSVTSMNKRSVSTIAKGLTPCVSHSRSRASSASVSPTLRSPARSCRKRAEKSFPQHRRGIPDVPADDPERAM